MRISKIGHLILLFVFLSPSVLCNARHASFEDEYSHINIQVTHSQGVPKSSSIQATVNGHYLSVVFTANMGQVVVKVADANEVEVDSATCYTPNSVGFYIPNAGSYIVTFSFADGDSYYGEFEITD